MLICIPLSVDWPETCKFLSTSEKELLIARLAADVADAKMNRLDEAAYKRAFGDWKVYVGILMYFGIVNNGYSVSVRMGAVAHHLASISDLTCCISSRQLFSRTWDTRPSALKSIVYQSSVSLAAVGSSWPFSVRRI